MTGLIRSDECDLYYEEAGEGVPILLIHCRRNLPEEWPPAGRENASAAVADFRNSIGVYPRSSDLATVTVPVVCSYSARSPASMVASCDCSPLPSVLR